MSTAPDDGRVPIETVLSGLSIHPLGAGELPIDAFVLLKLKDADGHLSWSYRTTSTPNREELLGALLVQADLLRKELLDEWIDEP